MRKGRPVEIEEAFGGLAFFGERTPEFHRSRPETFAGGIADHRNGGVFVAHWGGSGEWERHPNGDEVVVALEGRARVFLIEEGEKGQSPAIRLTERSASSQPSPSDQARSMTPRKDTAAPHTFQKTAPAR